MAEDYLGISAHFDVSEVVTGFKTLFDLLQKAGAVSEETANQLSASLSTMQTNLSNGLTAEGLKDLFAELDGIQGKVTETLNAFAESSGTLSCCENIKSGTSSRSFLYSSDKQYFFQNDHDGIHLPTIKYGLNNFLTLSIIP